MTSAIDLDVALFFVATLLGAMAAGVAGFAFGLVASAIWLYIIPPAESAPLIAAFAILIQGATLWKLRHALQIWRLVPFVVGGAIGVPLGAAALSCISADRMRAFVGGVLVLFSLYNLARPKLPAVKGGALADGIVGIMSGALSGSSGLAGIPVIMWSSLRRWSRDDQRALFQPVVIAIFVMTLLWFGGTGIVTAATLRWFWIGLPAALIGTWLGLKLYGRLDEASFRIVVLGLLLACGLSYLPWP
jgi:hypothetical protein